MTAWWSRRRRQPESEQPPSPESSKPRHPIPEYYENLLRQELYPDIHQRLYDRWGNTSGVGRRTSGWYDPEFGNLSAVSISASGWLGPNRYEPRVQRKVKCRYCGRLGVMEEAVRSKRGEKFHFPSCPGCAAPVDFDATE